MYCGFNEGLEIQYVPRSCLPLIDIDQRHRHSGPSLSCRSAPSLEGSTAALFFSSNLGRGDDHRKIALSRNTLILPDRSYSSRATSLLRRRLLYPSLGLTLSLPFQHPQRCTSKHPRYAPNGLHRLDMRPVRTDFGVQTPR